jgi:uncharacterized protein (DUF2384 family)
MNVIQTNQTGSPTIVDIWAVMKLPARGTALHEFVRTVLPFELLDRISGILQVVPQVIVTAICISPSTLARRAKARCFNTAESDRLISLVGITRLRQQPCREIECGAKSAGWLRGHED